MVPDKYLIMRDRPFMLAPLYWNLISQSSKVTEKIHGGCFSISWNIFYNGRTKGISLSEDWQKKGEIIADRLLSNKLYVKSIKSAYQKVINEISDFVAAQKDINYSTYEFERLVKTARQIYELFLHHDEISVMPWWVAGDIFFNRLNKILNLTEDDFKLITLPPQKSYVNQYEQDLLVELELIKAEEKDIKTAAAQLSENYGWIPFGYDGPEFWDIKYFENLLEEKLKTFGQKEIEELKQIKIKDQETAQRRQVVLDSLDHEQVRLLEIAWHLTYSTDQRKKSTYSLFVIYARILEEMSGRYNLPYLNLKYLFIDELALIESDPAKILTLTNERINNQFILEAVAGKVRFLNKAESEKFLAEINAQMQSLDITGQVASHGPQDIYKAKVKILLNPQESSKVETGDFLVATMTSPDYIVAMKKASGFITDEGGVTCHAAIVAREMNKPCIIGTKNATQILKDGDQIEMDLDHGTIKIIK